MVRAIIALVWGAKGLTEEARVTREDYSKEGGLEVSSRELAALG